MWTRIPVKRLDVEESERLLHMEDTLHNQVVGQGEAVNMIARAVRRARAGIKDPKRPDWSVPVPRSDGCRQDARR